MSGLIIAKVTLVFALASFALVLMRRASAAQRHLVLVVALLASLLIPLLDLVLPSWEVLPRIETPAVIETVAPRPASQESGSSGSISPSYAPVRSARAGTRAREWLLIAWLCGVGAQLALLAARAAAVQWSAHRARPLRDEHWQRLLDETSHALGVCERAELRIRGARTMPAVWGWRKPVVLLPEDCTGWPDARCRDVLAHELAHVARRDVAVALLGHAACALHWFNPLAWMLRRRLEAECERACDDLALAHGAPATRYADNLITIAARYRTRRSVAPVMAAHSQLEGRVMAILATDQNRRRASSRVRLGIAALAAALLAPLSTVAWSQAGGLPGGGGESRWAESHSQQFAEHLDALDIATGDVEALLAGLVSSDVVTRAASAWALGKTGDARAIDPLIEAGYDADAVVRQWAVRSLGAWNAPRIAALLIDRLRDPDAEVRQWAVRTMAGHDGAVTTGPLIGALGDDDAEVREWAARGLAGAQGQQAAAAMAVRVAVEQDAAVSEWLVRSLAGNASADARDALINATYHASSEVRQWAVRGLAGWRDDLAVDAMIRTLGDTDDEVREWSVRGLGFCGNDRAMAPLLEMERDAVSDVREWAGRSLETIACEPASAAL